MEKKILSDRILPVLLLLDGLGASFAAIFAYQLGIDANPDWSSARWLLLCGGLALIAVAIFFPNLKKIFAPAARGILSAENFKTLALLAHLWALIFGVYAWFITYGNFTTWDHTTRYYAQLADGFNAGHLYLPREPDKALLEAADPNDETNRPTFDDDIWDLSLYKGRFYLYWGPVPSLLLAPVQKILAKPVTDIYLVYFFLCGLAAFNGLILVNLWRRFFSRLSAWRVFPPILLAAFVAPIPWSLNIPQVYEAAIGAGQFFLMGGAYFALLAAREDAFDKKYLFLAGTFWACSVGSRALNALSVAFFAALIYFLACRSSLAGGERPLPKLFAAFKHLLPLFVPLFFGAVAIGWYNWARFDSPFEFGLQYQITIVNLKRHTDWVFRPEYFLPNFYNYLFQPFDFVVGFPFIRPRINADFVPIYFYAAGPVTGLLFSAPFLIFAAGLLLPPEDERPAPYRFFLSLLAGSFIINLLTLLFYFFSQTRFLVDLISQIMLLAILGYWQLSARQRIAKIVGVAGNLLLVASLCLGLLLSFTSETKRFETLNPGLIQTFSQPFSR